MKDWFIKAVNSGFIQRRISYYTILGLTVFCVIETWSFAKTGASLGYNGTEVAAIIAAIWLPMGTLQGHIFTKHKESEKRREDNADK